MENLSGKTLGFAILKDGLLVPFNEMSTNQSENMHYKEMKNVIINNSLEELYDCLNVNDFSLIAKKMAINGYILFINSSTNENHTGIIIIGNNAESVVKNKLIEMYDYLKQFKLTILEYCINNSYIDLLHKYSNLEDYLNNTNNVKRDH